MYLPATHCKQVPPSDPVYPLLQRQWVAAALPLGELESAGHAAQVPAEVAEVVVRYVPAAQAVHVASLCVSTLHLLLNNWKPMGSCMSFEIEIIGITHSPSPLHSVSGFMS